MYRTDRTTLQKASQHDVGIKMHLYLKNQYLPHLCVVSVSLIHMQGITSKYLLFLVSSAFVTLNLHFSFSIFYLQYIYGCYISHRDKNM